MSQVSVLVPIYNEERYLVETLNSLKSQDIDAKFILSDNNSSDSSHQICQEFSHVDDRFKVFRQKENIGAFGNSLFLLDQINTEFFMFLGAHDVLSSNYFDYVLEPIKSDKNIAMSIGQPAAINEKSEILGYVEKAVYDFSSNEKIIRYLKSLHELIDCTCFQSLCRTSNLRGFEFRETISCDHVFISHMLLMGKLHVEKNAAYIRRYFPKERELLREERITGKSKKLDRHDFYKYYLDHFRKNFDGDETILLFLENKILTILEARFGTAALFPSRT